jgi:hypothetical protein
VGERLRPLPPLEDDALSGLVGLVEGSSGDSVSVDEVVYGSRRSE